MITQILPTEMPSVCDWIGVNKVWDGQEDLSALRDRWWSCVAVQLGDSILENYALPVGLGMEFVTTILECVRRKLLVFFVATSYDDFYEEAMDAVIDELNLFLVTLARMTDQEEAVNILKLTQEV